MLNKKNIIRGAICIILVLCSIFSFIRYGVFEAPLPWKVTDTSDARFNPEKFRLTDYGSDSQFQKSLSILFPVGTEKSYVDRISVDVGGATVEKFVPKHPMYHDNIYFDYGYHNKARWTVRNSIPFIPPLSPDWPSHFFRVEYDKDLNVKKVTSLSALSFPKYYYNKEPKWLREINDGFTK